MIIGLTFIAFLVINGWVTGHSDLEITRNISAQNVYKGDDILVEVTVTNNSYRRTQLLEIFDNVPHEMKMRRGINQMRMNLGPGQSATMRYTVRCPLRGHYTVGPVSVRHRNAFNLFVNESKVDDRTDITVFPQVREVEEALLRSNVPKMYTGATTLKTPGQGMEFYSLREYLPGDAFRMINWKAFARTGELMVNEKTRDAVTDVFIILDTRDVARIESEANTMKHIGYDVHMIFVNTYGSGHKVILDYIYRVDEDFFPAHFRLALEYDLASVFAGSVARDAGMIREFKQMADRQFLISKNIDSSEVTTKQLDVNRYINLRNSTRTDV